MHALLFRNRKIRAPENKNQINLPQPAEVNNAKYALDCQAIKSPKNRAHFALFSSAGCGDLIWFAFGKALLRDLLSDFAIRVHAFNPTANNIF